MGLDKYVCRQKLTVGKKSEKDDYVRGVRHTANRTEFQLKIQWQCINALQERSKVISNSEKYF